MSAEDNLSSEAKAFAAYIRKAQAEYASICSRIMDAAMAWSDPKKLVEDLQKALKAGHSRRTYNSGGGR